MVKLPVYSGTVPGLMMGMGKGGSIEIQESEGEYTIDKILLKDEP